jgi:dynein heavy chain 1
MLDLCAAAERWLENIPETMEKLVERSDSIKNPLFRFMRREFGVGMRVLSRMQSGLQALILFVKGEIKATNDLRQLVNKLSKEEIPPKWKIYDVYPLGISHWILDFVKRITQLNKIAGINYVSKPESCMWLGGFFSPAGFIAATRQYVAQKNRWPLESLVMTCDMGESDYIPNSFVFEGLTLYGAGWDRKSGCLVLTEKTQTPLPPSRFIWSNREECKDNSTWEGEAPPVTEVVIPVYLNSSFLELLFSVNLPVFSALPKEIWVQRAVSVSVWST